MPDQATVAATPDDHLRVLVELAEHYEKATAHFVRAGVEPMRGIPAAYAKRAAAIRWILAETAYGVDPSEVVL